METGCPTGCQGRMADDWRVTMTLDDRRRLGRGASHRWMSREARFRQSEASEGNDWSSSTLFVDD